MSGKTKRIVYRISDMLILLALVAGAVLLVVFGTPSGLGPWESAAWAGFLAASLLRIPAAIHELGHLLFGLMGGMRCAGITLSFLTFGGGKVRFARSDHAGETRMFPRSAEHVRAGATALAAGGALLGLLVGGALLALFLALPYHPALLFCGLFSLLVLYEGLRALLPAELPAGKTDGAVLIGLLRRRPEEEVLLCVLTAQGTLYRGSFSDLAKEQLSAPVVREDLPAFRALLLLRTQLALFQGEEEEAEKLFARLKELEEYCTAQEAAELQRYERYFAGEGFVPERSPLAGVNELEKELAGRMA